MALINLLVESANKRMYKLVNFALTVNDASFHLITAD